jgi:sugar phosphate isomerase/epimerase
VQDNLDIGISTGAYAHLSLAAALSRIAEIAPFAEVCSWGRHSLREPENAHAVASCGLPVTVHGPFTRDALGTRSRRRRQAALDLHRRHLAVAAEVGATLYVIHPDMRPRAGPWNPRIAARLQRSFEELRTVQEELGVAVVVENMPFHGRSHFIAPGDLDLQGLGLAFDIGHAAIAGTLLSWLADPQAPLRHLHLHDNRGHRSGDLHYALGAGVIDVAPALARARDAGASIVLEHTVEADVGASLDHLRARGLLVLSDAARNGVRAGTEDAHAVDLNRPRRPPTTATDVGGALAEPSTS